jgi:hypothetical protein
MQAGTLNTLRSLPAKSVSIAAARDADDRPSNARARSISMLPVVPDTTFPQI